MKKNKLFCFALNSYRNGIWQFNNSGKDIHRELYERFNQIEDIRIERLYSYLLVFH
jgi:hypothetical protein